MRRKAAKRRSHVNCGRTTARSCPGRASRCTKASQASGIGRRNQYFFIWKDHNKTAKLPSGRVDHCLWNVGRTRTVDSEVWAADQCMSPVVKEEIVLSFVETCAG